jgi:hypothetical protein
VDPFGTCSRRSTDMSRGLDAPNAAPSRPPEQSSTEWSHPLGHSQRQGSFDDGRAVGKAEKAQHVSGDIDERVERGRTDGLAERDRHDAARQAPRGGHPAVDESNRAEDPTSGHRPGVSPDEQLARRRSVEEGIEGAAAGTTCGSQTTANTAPSTSRSRRRPWASSASQKLLAPSRRSTRSRGRPGVGQQR